jgi:RNA polymerase sigma-70 factor (ECF subfamily)
MTFAWWFGKSSSSDDGRASHRRPRLVRLDAEREAASETSVAESDPITAAIRAGSVTAFEQLFRTEYEGLTRFATRYTRSVEIAEDIVTDVFAVVWQQRETWRTEHGPRAYLYGAVRNRAINTMRDARRRLEIETSLAAGDTAPEMSTPQDAADVLWEREEPLRALDRLLVKLSPRVRLVLELRWHHQLDFDAIAAALGTTRATAFNLHARAMKALRKIFPQAYREYLE